MPLQKYKCNNCHYEFKELVRNEDARVSCPGCKSFDVKKLMPKCVTRYKGDGFYSTDYNGSDDDEET